MKLGAQAWYGDISGWDSMDQLAKVKAYYANPSVGIEDAKTLAADAISIYPNPANSVLNISSEFELSSVKFYDVTGRMVKLIDTEW